MTTAPGSTRSRRAFLAAVLGGLGAAVAGTLERSAPVAASNGQTVQVGGDYAGDQMTRIVNTDTVHGNPIAIWGQSIGSGTALYGHGETGVGVGGWSPAGIGIIGANNSSTKPGLEGRNFAGNTGVLGYTGSEGGDPGTPAHTGVYGYAAQPGGRGGAFHGRAAQVRLEPNTASTHPASGLRGDLFVDKAGRLWFCKGGPIWKQIA